MGRISERKKQLIAQAAEMSLRNTKNKVLQKSPKRNKPEKVVRKKKGKKILVSKKRRPRLGPSRATFDALNQRRAKNRWKKLRNLLNLQKGNLKRVNQVYKA